MQKKKQNTQQQQQQDEEEEDILWNDCVMCVHVKRIKITWRTWNVIENSRFCVCAFAVKIENQYQTRCSTK